MDRVGVPSAAEQAAQFPFGMDCHQNELNEFQVQESEPQLLKLLPVERCMHRGRKPVTTKNNQPRSLSLRLVICCYESSHW